MKLNKRSILWAVGGVLLAVAVGVAVRLGAGLPVGPPSDVSTPSAALPRLKGEMGDFSYFASPRPVPAIAFQDGDGKALSLADFKGKVVLVNFWATWCAPCVREMPSLDRLQARLGGPDFTVLDISLDREGKTAVGPYFAANKLSHLGTYIDPKGDAFRAWQGRGVPTSFLIDRNGASRGVLLGPAAWDSPSAMALIRRLIDEGKGGTAS